jgi:hypothetical protein
MTCNKCKKCVYLEVIIFATTSLAYLDRKLVVHCYQLIRCYGVGLPHVTIYENKLIDTDVCLIFIEWSNTKCYKDINLFSEIPPL